MLALEKVKHEIGNLTIFGLGDDDDLAIALSRTSLVFYRGLNFD
jgi:hypothetical protein